MSSIDRLIALSRKTGDRLIIHDPKEDKTMVVMSLSDYEYLIEGRKNIHKLSDSQLLDQINRDIAVWRSSHVNESFEQGEDMIDIFSEKMGKQVIEEEASDWHPTSQVIEEHYDKDLLLSGKLETAGDNSVEKLEIDWEDYLPGEEEVSIEDTSTKIEIDPVGEIDSPLPEPSEWEEEPLDDSPVFYEEPV